ncbi:MAG TPA: hypothetical protein VNA57_00005 [Acidimicrobiales bacterium]|nr:hypothetical protein [Acidimicrobiales bacterium]
MEQLSLGVANLGLDPATTVACLIGSGEAGKRVVDALLAQDHAAFVVAMSAFAAIAAKCLDPNFPSEVLVCFATAPAFATLIDAIVDKDPVRIVFSTLALVAAGVACLAAVTRSPKIEPAAQTRQKGEKAEWRVDIMKDLVPRTMSFDYGDGTPPTTVSVPAGSDMSTFYFSHTFAGGIVSSSSSEASESTSVPDTGTGTYGQSVTSSASPTVIARSVTVVR